MCDVGRGNLAISKLLALKIFGPFLRSIYYWMSCFTHFLGGGASQPNPDKTLAARGLEELRVNLLLKENSYVSNIILHRSLILELKFFKLYVLICIFSSLVKQAFIYKLFYELILF